MKRQRWTVVAGMVLGLLVLSAESKADEARAGASKRWLLLHEYQPCQSFDISVPGPEECCRQVAAVVVVLEQAK